MSRLVALVALVAFFPVVGTVALISCAAQVQAPRTAARGPRSHPTPPREAASPALIRARLLALLGRGEVGGLRHAAAIEIVYRQGAASVRFVRVRDLSPAGERLLVHLGTLVNHGLDPQRERLRRIAALRQEQRAVAAHVPVDRQQALHVAAQLELLLADGLLRYTHDQSRRHLKVARLRARWEQRSLAPRAVLIQQRLVADLRSVRDVTSLEALLRAVEPPHPQYRRLVRAHARYRALVARGGWRPLASVEGMTRGRRHPQVAALKARLALEGYYQGLVDPRFDGALQQAVARYQVAHQLRPTGRPDRALLRELNVPAARRLTAIELTLQRWRESGVGASDYYVLVNVPDYHVEVWRRGQRLLRKRVIVGKSNKTTCDERTHRRVLAHATPLLSARIERVVFSPFWNVPRDIKERELDPEVGKDPDYYRKKGYELLDAGTAQERARELPGPGNSLGFVKFIFPNPHQVYLHDTPSKRLFDRPTRASSHGCARVQDPFALAAVLLRGDDSWDAARYTRLQRRWRALGRRSRRGTSLRREVPLRRPVPIHIEYYAVRVDSRGAVSFLGDVYGLDRDRLHPRRARRCVPESVRARRRFRSLKGRLAALQSRADALAGCNAAARAVAASSRKSKQLLRFGRQLENLASKTRRAHAAVAADLEQSKRGWTYALRKRAVGVDRLFGALVRLARRAQRSCRELSSVAAATRRNGALDRPVRLPVVSARLEPSI